MVKRYLLSLIIALLFLPIVSAGDYYADIEISVDESGLAAIKGESNYLNFITEGTDRYTSKKQSYWLFELSTEEVFSDYFVLVRLPEGASVNYVKSSGNFRIENLGERLGVRVFGQDEEMSIKIQYQIVKSEKSYIGIIITLSIVIIGIFLYFIIKSKKLRVKDEENKSKEDKSKKEEINYNLDGLTARQKKIMAFLIEKNKPMIQAEIEKELNLPKSSVSRNIKSLELKGKIEKERAGMSNIIRIREE